MAGARDGDYIVTTDACDAGGQAAQKGARSGVHVECTQCGGALQLNHARFVDRHELVSRPNPYMCACPCEVQLGALNTIIGRADCMSSSLMGSHSFFSAFVTALNANVRSHMHTEMLMASSDDPHFNAEYYARVAPTLSRLKLPRDVTSLLGSLGYRLNDSQRVAFDTTMRRSLTLVQGGVACLVVFVCVCLLIAGAQGHQGRASRILQLA